MVTKKNPTPVNILYAMNGCGDVILLSIALIILVKNMDMILHKSMMGTAVGSFSTPKTVTVIVGTII